MDGSLLLDIWWATRSNTLDINFWIKFIWYMQIYFHIPFHMTEWFICLFRYSLVLFGYVSFLRYIYVKRMIWIADLLRKQLLSIFLYLCGFWFSVASMVSAASNSLRNGSTFLIHKQLFAAHQIMIMIITQTKLNRYLSCFHFISYIFRLLLEMRLPSSISSPSIFAANDIHNLYNIMPIQKFRIYRLCSSCPCHCQCHSVYVSSAPPQILHRINSHMSLSLWFMFTLCAPLSFPMCFFLSTSSMWNLNLLHWILYE